MNEHAPAQSDGMQTTSAAPGKESPVQLRCPHCHNPIALADTHRDEVLCPGCGSSFRVRDARLTETVSTSKPLGKFRLLERVGQGAFGAVWKARDSVLDRVVALKIPHTGLVTEDEDLQRFHREARAAAQLRHPGIVTVHDVETLNGLPVIVSDFVQGVTLRDLLQVRRLTFGEAAELVASLAEALNYAHTMGLVHRDIKPANIMLERGPDGARAGPGRPMLMDFGLALRDEAEVTLTLDGHVIGTPAYMSPEQASGKSHHADRRSDVYSLGVVLYELLSGELPFRGSKQMILYQVLQEEPRSPRSLNDRLPRDLETICLKCLQKEPSKRYATAGELAADLRRFLAGEPIRARPVGSVERAVKWMRRHTAVAALMAAVLLVTVLGVAGIVWKYLDAERQKGIALHEADKATKARDFLVRILRISETDTQGGNVTARQILADAEKRIPVEFADQPELRAELVAVIEDVKRGIARRIPQAMLLEVRGTVRLHSAAGVQKAAVPQALVNLDDRLSLGADGQVQLVFLSDLHKERLKPGREVTIDVRGCEPADAILQRDDSVLMTFVRLPKATFYMGWDGQEKGVKTEIKEDFEIAAHDVTQGQWEAVIGSNPSWFSRKGNGRNNVLGISDEELKLFPVEQVSWDDTQAFIKKLNEKERGRGYLYRLPSEAEWEYACRGGTTSEEECSYHFYFDRPTNDLSSEQANFNGNYPFGKAPKGKFLQRPTRVGAYPSNKLGLCDMHGNVFQWCEDLFDPKGSGWVVRGGNWGNVGARCRAADRYGSAPTLRDRFVGFRLARVPVR